MDGGFTKQIQKEKKKEKKNWRLAVGYFGHNWYDRFSIQKNYRYDYKENKLKSFGICLDHIINISTKPASLKTFFAILFLLSSKKIVEMYSKTNSND